MARKPQGPWWRADRGAYYVRLDGKQIRLDADHSRTLAKFQALISRPSGPLSVSKLVLSYLDGVNVAPLTLRTYKQRLHSFASVCGEMAATDVRPLHVTAWLQALGVGPSTQVISRRIVKICWQWATDQGHLESNPLAKLRVGQIGARDCPSESDLSVWLKAAQGTPLEPWAAVALETGMRPGEQRGLAAADLNGRGAKVTGKGGKRTVHLSERAVGLLAELAERHPSGPLLRSEKGLAWTAKNLNNAFGRVPKECGRNIVPYHLRHVFATRLHRRGVDVLTISRLLGHSSIAMAAKHYVAVDSLGLLNALDHFEIL